MSFLENFQNIFDRSLQQFLKIDVKDSEVQQEESKLQLIEKLKGLASDIFAHLDDIQAFAERFGDEQSCRTFAAEVNYLIFSRLNLNFASIFVSPFNYSRYQLLEESYNILMQSKQAPKFVPLENNSLFYPIATTFVLRQYAYDRPNRKQGKFEVSPGEVVVNCGACTGDSTIWFYQEGAAQVHSFEPVPDACAQMKKNLELNGYPTDLVYQLAVGKRNCELHFLQTLTHIGSSFQIEMEQGQNLNQQLKASQVANQSYNEPTQFITAKCVVLDEWLEQNKIVPTYIKMDLEGAEPEALAGLERTISTYKPKLAICLYHRPSDMWTIPQQILQMYPNYTFYCKKSSINEEFVLFAIAE